MMILPPPRNPPYRTPTPKNSPPPPDPDASPKRKRTQQSPAESAPLCVNTAVQREITPETSANSPRTKVAERLQDLNLRQVPAQDGKLPSSSQSPRKRLKRNPHLRDVYRVPELVRTPGQEPTCLEVPESVETIELAEMPATRDTTMSLSPPTSPTAALQAFRAHRQGPSHIPAPSPPSKRRLSSPPLRSPATYSPNDTAIAIDTPLPQISASEDLDLAALTWQESEITGHEIDATSPDDDGEGINGIGFRPTAAIAYARSQKRRKAVEDWKAREAREARQRRFNRRRGGSSDPVGDGEGDARRSVRFVGVG